MNDISISNLFLNYDEKYILCTGARDKRERLILSFPDVKTERSPNEILGKLIYYFCQESFLSTHEDFVVVIDRRSSSISDVKELLIFLEKNLCKNVKEVFILKPQAFFIDAVINKLFKSNFYHKIHMCNSFSKLEISIDRKQLNNSLGYDSAFNFDSWKYYRENIECIVQNSSSLLESTKEFLISSINNSNVELFSLKSFQYIQDCYSTSKKDLKNLRNRLNFLRNDIRKCEETVSSLCLSVDQIFHIIFIERTLNSLQTCLESLEKFYHFYLQIRNTVESQLEFDYDYQEIFSYLSYWELLIMSSKEYFPGQPGAPALEKMFENAKRVAYLPECPQQIINDYGDSIRKLFSIYDKIKETSDQAYALSDKLNSLLNRARDISAGKIKYSSNRCKMILMSFDNPSTISSSDSNNNPNSNSSNNDSEMSNMSDFSESDCESHLQKCQICRDGSTTDKEILTMLRKKAAISIDPIKNSIGQRIEVLKRLNILANEKLPQVTEQMTTVFGLFQEMQTCCYWTVYGERICQPFILKVDEVQAEEVETKPPTNNHNLINIPSDLSNDECEKIVNEIERFTQLKSTYITNLANPKAFRKMYSKYFTSSINSDLTILLSQVERIQETTQLVSLQLQKKISRRTYHHLNNSSSQNNNSNKINNCPNYGEESTIINSPIISKLVNATNIIFKAVKCDEKTATMYDDNYQLAWDELIDTERRYLKSLIDIYEVYWTSSPPLFHFESKKLLANWNLLLEFHQDICYEKLKESQGIPKEIQSWAELITNRMIDLYTVYCSVYENLVMFASSLERDKLTSSWITERQELLNSREFGPDSKALLLPLKSRLITPVQRFQKYHLLLDRLVKYCIPKGEETETSKRDHDSLKSAHSTLLKMCETVNVIMRFRGCNMPPSSYGSKLLQENFTILKDDSRLTGSSQRTVFLFENCVVLTKYRAPGYVSNRLGLFSSSYLSACESYVSNENNQVIVDNDQLIPSSAVFSEQSDNEKQTTNERRTNTNGPSMTNCPTDSNGSRNNSIISSFSIPSTVVPTIGIVNSATSSNIASSSQNSIPVQNLTSSIFERSAVYEIKAELTLSEVGLTSAYRDDKRKFALWRDGRSETFIFQHQNPKTREIWTDRINDLLMSQLVKLRDNANTFRGSNKNSSQYLGGDELIGFDDYAYNQSKVIPPNKGSIDKFCGNSFKIPNNPLENVKFIRNKT